MATTTPIEMVVKRNRSVTVSLGYTMNIGNFESMRMDYSVTDTVKEGELIDEAILRVEKTVEEHLVRRIKEEKGE